MNFLLAPSPSVAQPLPPFSAFSFQPACTDGAIGIQYAAPNAPGRPGLTSILTSQPQAPFHESCGLDHGLQPVHVPIETQTYCLLPALSPMHYLSMSYPVGPNPFPPQLLYTIPQEVETTHTITMAHKSQPKVSMHEATREPKRDADSDGCLNENDHEQEHDHSTSSDLLSSPPAKSLGDEVVRRIVPRITGNDHTCKVCQKALATRQQLKQHIASEHVTTDEEKPFKCPACHLSFKRIAHLHRHQIVHNGARTFECPKCDKTFARNDHLTAHLWTHETGPFLCHVCQYQGSTRADLKSHTTTVHPLRKRRATRDKHSQ